jgi:glycosyltransferase involved in cell wall biosynthesis
MVAAAFPPTGGPGVQRPAKFAKYLPRLGWRPIVWTLDRIDDLPSDPTLLDDLPIGVTVHRWGDDSGIRTMRRALRRHCEGRGVASRFARAIDWRLCTWSARTLLPDDCVCWAKTSVGPLLRLIERDGVDAIYSTYSPASNHLLGLTLKRETNLPWLADFRDLWTDDYQYHEPSKRRRRAHRRLEQEIVEAADVVVGVTDRQTEILARRVPHARHKFVTITNGFDEDDFLDGADHHARIDPVRRDRGSGFVLTYVGRFDRWRTSEALLAGLERFVSTVGTRRDRFTFRVVGHANADVRRRLDTTGVRCVFTGYVSHREAIEEMRSADALLLNIPDGLNADSVITGKVFEYLAAQRPILVVGPQGSAGEALVRENEAGLTVSFDAGAVAQALEHLFSAWKAGMPLVGCTRARAEPFSRTKLTRKLATILDSLVNSNGAVDRSVGLPVEVCAS